MFVCLNQDFEPRKKTEKKRKLNLRSKFPGLYILARVSLTMCVVIHVMTRCMTLKGATGQDDSSREPVRWQ